MRIRLMKYEQGTIYIYMQRIISRYRTGTKDTFWRIPSRPRYQSKHVKRVQSPAGEELRIAPGLSTIVNQTNVKKGLYRGPLITRHPTLSLG